MYSDDFPPAFRNAQFSSIDRQTDRGRESEISKAPAPIVQSGQALLEERVPRKSSTPGAEDADLRLGCIGMAGRIEELIE
jgi:hypothetical protein